MNESIEGYMLILMRHTIYRGASIDSNALDYNLEHSLLEKDIDYVTHF